MGKHWAFNYETYADDYAAVRGMDGYGNILGCDFTWSRATAARQEGACANGLQMLS
jgi:hypothetical protein